MLGPVIDQLQDAVGALQACARDDSLTWPEVRDGLVRLERLREQFDHAVGALVAASDVRGDAARDGARNMADWLAKQTGQRRTITGSRAWLAGRLRSMPRTDEALADGTVTASHARVLTRAQTERTVEAFARDEDRLVDAARRLSADELVQVVEHWLRHADPDGSAPTAPRDDVFHLSVTLGGRLKGDFDFGGDLAIRARAIIDEVVTQLLHRERKERESGLIDERAGETMSRRRARAFGELLDRAAGSPDNPARRQPLFVVQTTVETLTGSGDPVDWHTQVDLAWRAAIPVRLRDQWACDAHISRAVLNAARQPLDLGRSVRTATVAQRRALLAEYGGCAVPGCSAPACRVEIHHHVHWIDGGPTDLSNLFPACPWHHRMLHSGDMAVDRDDSGAFSFSTRDGRRIHDSRAGPVDEVA